VLVPGRRGAFEEVARLASGDFFGEMALMTGEPRNATVRAAEDTEVLVLRSEDVKDVLAAQKDLAEAVSRVLAERQAKLDERLAKSSRETSQHDVAERTTHTLGKVKKFFAL
jgi:CRP-like cAMP-binding protein